MNKTIFFYPRRKDTKWAVAYPEKVRGVYIEQIKLTCSSYTEALRIASALNAECAKDTPYRKEAAHDYPS